MNCMFLGEWFVVVWFVCVLFVWGFFWVCVEVTGLKLGGMRCFLFPTLLICWVGHLETSDAI